MWFQSDVLRISEAAANDTGLSDEVILSICHIAEEFGIKKLILFGSRARGDYSRASDIDLAASGNDIGLFHTELEERVPTLLTFDVIDLGNKCSEDILKSINEEGIVFYEEI